MAAWQHWLALQDFFVSDNDGLYALFMLAAVGLAVVLIVVVMRQSHTLDQARKARGQAPDLPDSPLASETVALDETTPGNQA